MENGLPLYTRLNTGTADVDGRGPVLDLLAAWTSPLGLLVLAVVPLPRGWKPLRKGEASAEQRTSRGGRSWVSRGRCTYLAECSGGAVVDITLRAEPSFSEAGDGQPPLESVAEGARVQSRGVVPCGGHDAFFSLGEHRRAWGWALFPSGSLALEWTCSETQRRLTLRVEGGRATDLAALLPLLAHLRCH